MTNHASETEIWKEIPNNNKYEVSTCGNVRHATTKFQQKFDVEKLKSTKTRIRFHSFYLHRLVALTFIPNPDNLKEVNHMDGNPYNNHATNLEWITRENNMKHFHANNKYTCKYMRRILLIHAHSNVVERTFNCLEECIIALNLNVSYGEVYTKLNKKYNKKYNKKINNVRKNNYVGVTWSKTNNKFIVYHKKKYHGQFTDEVEAAQHYDAILRELYGKNAHVNFPAANENQAVVGKNLTFAKSNANDDANCIYKIDDNRFIKFEDNNQSLIYDHDADAGAGSDADANADAGSDADASTMIEWREVREAPRYMVSNSGQVKQKRLNRFMRGYLINGYRSVSLRSECPSGKICRLVHRLVADAFLANDDPVYKIYVDHIDTNVLNNDSYNLRWVTPKENMNNELTKCNISVGKLKNSKRMFKIDLTTKQVVDSYKNFKEVDEREPGISYRIIYAICNYYHHMITTNTSTFVYKTHGNHIFLFEDELARMNDCIEMTTGACKLKKILIVQYDKNTNECINEFESAYQASKELNINYSGINQVMNYHRYTDECRPKCYKLKTTHGFIFREKVKE